MTDPTPQAVTCKCGGNLVRVPGHWWVHQGYGSRCDNAEPTELFPAPQAPVHDGSEHYYAENFGMSVGTPAPQAQPGFRELKPMTDKDAAAKLREIFSDLQTRFHDQWDWMEAGFSLMVLETYLESVTEERDRAQDALTYIERQIPNGISIVAIALASSKSDRQPEGETKCQIE